jgi:predicted  nucleic acid-binding Zn-ribbon protein
MSHLIELQQCDTSIAAVERKMEEGPLRIKALDKELLEVQKTLDEELEEIETALKEKKGIEQEISDLERQLAKSNEKLGQIKSNKEYKAALKEIDDIKWSKGQLEEKLLSVMERLEQLTPKKKIHEAKKKELKASFDKEKAEIMKGLEELGARLEELRLQRMRISESVEKDLLGHYSLLRSRKAGIAVSAVVKGVCQTCHMGIPPQQFNELIRGEKIMDCPNCRRIIYWGDDGRFQKQGDQKE